MIPPGRPRRGPIRGNRRVLEESRDHIRGDKPWSRGGKIERGNKRRDNDQLRDPKTGAEEIRKMIKQISLLSVLQTHMGGAGPLA